MRRRQVLSLTAAGIAAALYATQGYKEAKAKKHQVGGTVLHGYGCNDLPSVAKTGGLHTDWMHVGWGSWLWDYSKVYPVNWTIGLYNIIPLASDVALVIQHPNYDGWWMLLNEPDLEYQTFDWRVAANIVNQQMAVVLGQDPGAKFAVATGSQGSPANQPDSYFSHLWPLITNQHKVKAFQTNFYVQSTPQYGFNKDAWLTALPINQYVKPLSIWRNQNYPDKQLWLKEIGLVKDAYFDTHDPSIYPAVIDSVCNGTIERWSWYGMSNLTTPNYVTLLQGNAATVTPTGHAFETL